MLLLHQVGSVKIGEVVRYTVTYTPSHDRILPSPEALQLRIRNTSAIALRAAFVHGPYTLSVSAVPAHFDPNKKFENPRRYGVPEFEPMLKSAGSWTCALIVPDDIRQSAGMGAARGDFGLSQGKPNASVSWVIEIASQVLFSSSASVGFEVLLARDEKSLTLSGSTPVIGNSSAQIPQPGRVSDFQAIPGPRDFSVPLQLKGVYSKAISLKVEDTASLWNTPRLPGWDDWGASRPVDSQGRPVEHVMSPPTSPLDPRSRKPPKKVHLVVLTHGIHSNLGADMLYLKESIDASVRQAKIDGKERRAREKAEREAKRKENGSEAESKPDPSDEEDKYEDEEVIVRGFSGNATKTERGLKFLGKRLARYVLSMTYPDQPFMPSVKSEAKSIALSLKGDAAKDAQEEDSGKPVHKHSTIHKGKLHERQGHFQITSISFIGHSLGGPVQVYAIAYIKKHSPQFFDLIRPVNFICLASPLLGLSNENPLYVKFALDFGLVGRTGQDLGLTWRAPTLARSGWGALVGSLGEGAHKKVIGEVQPESKPLLRILPTGPAHAALKKFRNRTVYSNVVNDGIVPLRTSCLLFLDWQGLGRVEKARREAGLVETLVGFGWAELTGANMSSPRRGPYTPDEDIPSIDSATSAETKKTHEQEAEAEFEVGRGHDREVPQPPTNATEEDDRHSLNYASHSHDNNHTSESQNSHTNNEGPLAGFLNFFKPDSPKIPKPPTSPKPNKIYQRSQTLKVDNNSSASSSKSRVTSGNEYGDQFDSVTAPPKTTFFESAGDLLNPKLPSIEFLIDPSHRPRTIFHDRVYHPSDIPPPPLKKRPTGALAFRRQTFTRSLSVSSIQSSKQSEKHSDSRSSSPYLAPQHHSTDMSQRDYDDTANTNPDMEPDEVIDSSNMKVEEKIARAYHKDLSWRKVLVKLEPDAHNNIIVRRMFANAHGWPVIKHLCDAHFSDSAAARMRDDEEESVERAKAINLPPDETGGETNTPGDESPKGTGKPSAKNPLGIQGYGSDDADDEGASGEDKARPDTSGRRPSMPFGSPLDRTDSELREAQDVVPDMSPTPGERTLGSFSLHASRERMDSVTWSDRDWADSEVESDMDDHLNLAYGKVHIRRSPADSPDEGDDEGERTQRVKSVPLSK